MTHNPLYHECDWKRTVVEKITTETAERWLGGQIPDDLIPQYRECLIRTTNVMDYDNSCQVICFALLKGEQVLLRFEQRSGGGDYYWQDMDHPRNNGVDLETILPRL